MVDKRFWTIAIAVVTISVAGAGALPSLLLAPAAQPEPLVVPPIAAALPAIQAKPAEAPVHAVSSKPAPVVEIAPTPPPQAASLPAAPPASEPVTAPEPVKPPEPAKEVAAAAFPPVQPIGVPAKREIAAATASGAPLAASAGEIAQKPENAKRTVRPQRTAERPRRVRPAPYPMREFLAWRR